MRHLAAHEALDLEAELRQGDIQSIELEVVDARGQVLAGSGPLALRNHRATWTWRPNDDASAKTLLDGQDRLEVEGRVKATIGGTEHIKSLDRISVFRDRVELTLRTAQGELVTRASVRLWVHGEGSVQKLGPIETGDDGVAAFTGLRRWLKLEPRVSSPWVLADPEQPWAPGKGVGLARELRVAPKRYDATILGIRTDPRLAFVELGELGGERRQYVNCERFDPNEDVPSPGEDPSHFGNRVELRVGPAANLAAMLGEMIHVELQPNANNATGAGPGPRLVGADADGVLALELGEDGATCVLELGCMAGDRFELRVSSMAKFGSAACVELVFVNWHQHYYALSLPRALTPALESATLAPEAGAGPHFDLCAEVRDHVAAVLDPVFVRLTLAGTTLRADGETQLVDAAMLGRDDGRPLRLGHPHTDAGSPGTRAAARTLALELFDLYFTPRVIATRHQLEIDRAELEFGPSEPGHLFVPDPMALAGVADEAPTWSAMPGPSAPTEHPGLDSEGRPRGGVLPRDAIELRTSEIQSLRLPAAGPEDPGSFVGPPSASSCPIRVTVSAAEFVLGPGCQLIARAGALAGSRAGRLCLDPVPDIVGDRLCHLVTHAFDLPLERPAPAGLDPSKHVDNPQQPSAP